MPARHGVSDQASTSLAQQQQLLADKLALHTAHNQLLQDHAQLEGKAREQESRLHAAESALAAVRQQQSTQVAEADRKLVEANRQAAANKASLDKMMLSYNQLSDMHSKPLKRNSVGSSLPRRTLQRASSRSCAPLARNCGSCSGDMTGWLREGPTWRRTCAASSMCLGVCASAARCLSRRL
ncbi:hypothetical protein HaLaN_02364 [Haematococcus lacustris]|uniref:Uncharacterized protein n=1 Tax=Haematococcus lacustris TaxID=44745 RepID=A0A699YKV1_HAELA|nr:hypothetical protein HaLaN_02364 [Haematococcus lacustris]